MPFIVVFAHETHCFCLLFMDFEARIKFQLLCWLNVHKNTGARWGCDDGFLLSSLRIAVSLRIFKRFSIANTRNSITFYINHVYQQLCGSERKLPLMNRNRGGIWQRRHYLTNFFFLVFVRSNIAVISGWRIWGSRLQGEWIYALFKFHYMVMLILFDCRNNFNIYFPLHSDIYLDLTYSKRFLLLHIYLIY